MFTKKVVTATGLYQAIGNGCNENKSSMSLNKMRQNLTKTTAVAAVIGVATCLFPAIAQAQVTPPPPPPLELPTVESSGDPNEQADVDRIEFSLKTSVQDIDSDDSVGKFPGAIENFRVYSEAPDVPNLLNTPPGNLTTSRLRFNANNEVDPIIVDYSEAPNIDNINLYDLSQDGTSKDWLRYDVTFPNTPATLTLFIPSNDLTDDRDLINSLSGLDEILQSGQVQAVVSRSDVNRVETRTAKVVESNPDLNRKALKVRVATVPEPTATASLLGVGTLGAITLLKRNRRQSKSV
jgi:hypothetical protein